MYQSSCNENSIYASNVGIYYKVNTMEFRCALEKQSIIQKNHVKQEAPT